MGEVKRSTVLEDVKKRFEEAETQTNLEIENLERKLKLLGLAEDNLPKDSRVIELINYFEIIGITKEEFEEYQKRNEVLTDNLYSKITQEIHTLEKKSGCINSLKNNLR